MSNLVSKSFVGLALIACASVALADLEQDRSEGIAWLLKHQNGDGSWGQRGAKVAATAEALAALRNSGADSGFLYSRAISWLANARTESADSLARKISALSAAGFDVKTLGLVDELLSMRDAQMGWGAFKGYGIGFPDTALALKAIHDTGIPYPESKVGLYHILSGQEKTNGGWSYIAGALGQGFKQQIMPSAYNLMTLTAFQSQFDMSVPISHGVDWLVNATQQSNGSFLEDAALTTGSVHKTALGYLAIKHAADAGVASGMESVLTSARNYILSSQMKDGGWENDALSTGLALQTLPSTTMTDTDGDGVPDAVEVLVGTDINVADGRDLLAGNGLDPDQLQHTGMSAPSMIVEVLANQSFSATPKLAGGASPFNWLISSGSLPVGVTLQSESNGTLSGTPVAPSSTSFALMVQDAASKKLVVPGFIRVLAADDFITDTDQDGAPSVFEITQGFDPLDTNSTPVLDSDGDMIVDWNDRFPNNRNEWADNDNDGTGNNADQDDDNDGMTDGYEVRYGLNPHDASDAAIDSDEDGLTNLEESYSYTDPFKPDTDGDGIDDPTEIAQGSNPNLDDKLIPVIISIITSYLLG